MSKLDLVLQRSAALRPNILATLQRVQEALGYVPPEAVPRIARALGVSDSDVAGVLSFYHDLRTEPPGRHLIRYCMGEACLATHCEKPLAALKKRIGCEFGQTSKDRRFTLQKVYCLGNCAIAPSMMVGEDVHGKVTPKSIPGILREYT